MDAKARIDENAGTRAQAMRRPKPNNRNLVRGAILRSLGKPDRRPSTLVEHRLHIRYEGTAF